jgi:hypothetical protein
MLNQSTLIFSLYASVAGALTVATGRKLVIQLQSEQKDLMHIACRIGILLLTVGTLLDNARTMFGTIELIPVYNFMNVVVAWFCVANHQVLAAFAFFTPSYFVYRLATHTQKWWISRIAVFVVMVLFSLGTVGFMAQQPNPLLVKSECTEINAPYSTLAPTKKVLGSLRCVFAYQFAMVGCGVYLVAKRKGCSCCCCKCSTLLSTLASWEFLFLIANFLCLPGQALLRSLGPVYRCYGSNFWEQVTFASAVYADYVLSEENHGKDSDVSPLTESLVTGDYSDEKA